MQFGAAAILEERGLALFAFAVGEVAEGFLILQARDTLGAGLEVEAQGPFDNDFAIAEIAGREDFRVLVLGEGDESNMQELCASYAIVGNGKDPLSRPDEWLPIYHCRGLKWNLQTQWPLLKRWH